MTIDREDECFYDMMEKLEKGIKPHIRLADFPSFTPEAICEAVAHQAERMGRIRGRTEWVRPCDMITVYLEPAERQVSAGSDQR